MRAFWPQFSQKVDQVMAELPAPKDEPVGKDCPLCGSPLVYRHNRKGDKFIGCSKFPECHYTAPLIPPKQLDQPCPDCGSVLYERINRRGKPFVGCSAFPKCRFIANYGPNGELVRYVPKEKPARQEGAVPAKRQLKGRASRKKAKPS